MSTQNFVRAFKKRIGYIAGMAITTSRKKTRIEDLRRTELIEAAHRVFLEHGLQGLTTTRICNEAGMSQGILTYYFSGKDAVLFEMVRYANRVLMQDVVERLRSAQTSWERISAILQGNFPPSHYERNTANAWISFYAAAATNKRYQRLQHLFYRRLHSNVASALRGAIDRRELDDLVRGTAAIIDGLWLRRGQDDELDSDIAIALVTAHVQKALGQERVNLLKAQATPKNPVN